VTCAALTTVLSGTRQSARAQSTLASCRVGAIRCRGFTRGVAQLGSVLRSGRRGRGFESRHPDPKCLVTGASTTSPTASRPLPHSWVMTARASGTASIRPGTAASAPCSSAADERRPVATPRTDEFQVAIGPAPKSDQVRTPPKPPQTRPDAVLTCRWMAESVQGFR
jgi:hypothetical protein